MDNPKDPTGSDRFSSESRLKVAYNAADFCVKVIRRFLVASDAPGAIRLDHTTREAIIEKWQFHGTDFYLWQDLVDAVDYAHGRISFALEMIEQVTPSRKAAKAIDEWSESCHSAIEFAAISLRDDLTEISNDSRHHGHNVFAGGKDSIAFQFIREKWKHRHLNCDRVEKLIFDEHQLAFEKFKQITHGPVEPDEFWWNGKCAKGFTIGQMRILKFAFDHREKPRNKQATLLALDYHNEGGEKALKRMMTDIRKGLADLGVVLGFKVGCLVFKDPPKPPKKTGK
jgi:hypothetical protein